MAFGDAAATRGLLGTFLSMRLSTSPVGPVLAVALFCAAVATPARAEPRHSAPAADNASAETNEWYEPVAPSAWSFLNDQTPSDSNTAPQASAAQPQPTAGLDGDSPEKPLTDEERQKLNEALVIDPLKFGDTHATPRRPGSTSSSG